MGDEVVLGIRLAGIDAVEQRISQMIADAEKRFTAMFSRVSKSGGLGGGAGGGAPLSPQMELAKIRRDDLTHQRRLQQGELRFAQQQKMAERRFSEQQRRLDEIHAIRLKRMSRDPMTSGFTGGAMAVGSRLAAAAGGLSLPAMAMRGFSGTVEGGHLSNQWKALEREVAGIAKPVVDRVTQIVAAARARLERMNPAQQDMALNAGMAVTAAGIGYAAGGVRGGLAGLGIAGGAYVGSKVWNSFQNLPGLPTKSEYAASPISRMNVDELDAYNRQLQKAKIAMDGMENKTFAGSKSVPDWLKKAAFLSGGLGSIAAMAPGGSMVAGIFGSNDATPGDLAAAQDELVRRSNLVKTRSNILSGQDPQYAKELEKADATRRMVMSADTIGYGSVGSTAQMIQEKLLASGMPAGSQRSATGILEDIYKLLETNAPKNPLDVIMNKTGDQAAGTVQ